MKVLNVLFSSNEWNPGPTALSTVITNGCCGFFNISRANVRTSDLIRIWSEEETNVFEKLIVYTAPVTGTRQTKWNGRMRTIIEFDTNESDWDDSGPQRPVFNRNGWAFTEEEE